MHALPATPAALIRVPPGPLRRTLWLRRPAGVVLLSRMIVPRGTVATVSAEIPGVAGVAVATANRVPNTCRPSGRLMVCTRGQEWCPMPAARWRVTLVKRAGPAGTIRFVFAVGPPPRTA
jgi:hypothetical protein